MILYEQPFKVFEGAGFMVSEEFCILKILSNLFKVLPRPNHCTLLEPGYGERIVFIATVIRSWQATQWTNTPTALLLLW